MCFFKKLKYQAATHPVFMNADIREMNDLVMGGAGSGKSAYYIGNLLMQADGSYVVCDPEGKLYRQYGGYLEYKGYNVRCLDLVNAEKRTRYNPLIHLDGSSDSISFFVDMIIFNTSRAEQAHDERDRTLLTALVMYLYDTADESQQTIDSLNSLLQAGASEGKVLDRLIGQQPHPFILNGWGLQEGTCPFSVSPVDQPQPRQKGYVTGKYAREPHLCAVYIPCVQALADTPHVRRTAPPY